MSFGVKATSPKNGGGDYEVPPDGANAAVLVGLIDLGTHWTEYKEGRKEQRMIYLLWELTAAPMSGLKDQNHLIGRDYSLTFGEKSLLRKLVETWRGKSFAEGEEFDPMKLLGQPCLLTIVHKQSGKGNTYARIEGISKPPKGMTIPPAKTKPFSWEISSGDPFPDHPWLPYYYGRKLSEKVAESKEWQRRTGAAAPAVNGDAEPETDPDSNETPF